MTTLSLEHVVEQNIRPTERSVKKVHRRDRGLDRGQAHYLDIMRGERYRARTVSLQLGRLTATYEVDSLEKQVVDEALRWVLGDGIDVHVRDNPVVQNVLGVQISEGGGVSACARQQSKRERRRHINIDRVAKSHMLEY